MVSTSHDTRYEPTASPAINRKKTDFQQSVTVFQMEGSLVMTAGIAQMLLQSHTEEIELLPALPKAWPTGSVKGLRARGNVAVDIEWKDGKVTGYRVASVDPHDVKVRINGETKTIRTEAP